MPGRAVVTSPGGTGAISIPSDPNFMCTGLVTVAPFFGSMKNARGFFFMACAPAIAPNPAIMTTTSSANGFLRVISGLLFRDILAEPTTKPSATAPLRETPGRRVPNQHVRGRFRGKWRVDRHRDD